MKYRKMLFWDFFLALLLTFTVIALSTEWLFKLKTEEILDQNFSSKFRKSMIPISQMFSSRVLSLLRPGDEETTLYRHLKAKTDQLLSLLGANSIVILDDKSQVVVTSYNHPIGFLYPIGKTDPIEFKRAWGGFVATSPIYHLDDNIFKTGYAPIFDEKGQVVYILCLEVSSLQQKILHQPNQNTVYFSMAGIAVAFFVSLLLWLFLAYPLHKLVNAMEVLSKNAYPEKLVSKRKDEIGFLIERFNFMLDSLYLQKIELRKAHQKELKHKKHLTLLGEFSAGISHKISDPLSDMEKLIKSLEQAKCDPNKLADKLIVEIDFLNKIVGEILFYAKDDSHKPQSISTLSLLSLVNKVLFEILVEDIEVQFSMDPKILTLFADPKELRTILINLLKNAVESMAESDKKKLTFCTHKSKQNIVISIIDTGEGIASDLLQSGKVFQPFFSTRKMRVGLGLPVVIKIIEKHQGQFAIESRENIGTTVKAFFPLKG